MQRCTKALLLPAQFTAAGLDELIFVFLGAAQGRSWHPLNLNRLRGLSDRQSVNYGESTPRRFRNIQGHQKFLCHRTKKICLLEKYLNFYPAKVCQLHSCAELHFRLFALNR